MIHARRLTMVAVVASLVVAILAGVARLGWNVPVAASYATDHGPLLVLAVFGSLIALERAVALGVLWAYAAPIAGALAGFSVFAGLRQLTAPLALVESIVLTVANGHIARKQPAVFTHLMLLGSLVLVVGTAAWAAGRPVFAVVPAWLAFFALTIVAERIEMSRLAPVPDWARTTIAVVCAAMAAAAVAAIARPLLASRALGITCALVAAWELRFDLARRTVRQSGLPRYAAVGVLVGSIWLGVSGLGLAALGLPPAGPVYDALLHAVFVGFVLSMVFAHAPIILPAVARVKIAFGRPLYVPLAVLHGALVLRVAGDLVGIAWLRRAGGLGNAVAIAVFASTIVLQVRRATALRAA